MHTLCAAAAVVYTPHALLLLRTPYAATYVLRAVVYTRCCCYAAAVLLHYTYTHGSMYACGAVWCVYAYTTCCCAATYHHTTYTGIQYTATCCGCYAAATLLHTLHCTVYVLLLCCCWCVDASTTCCCYVHLLATPYSMYYVSTADATLHATQLRALLVLRIHTT